MSNKLTRKGLAFGSATLLALATLVAAVPANAAVETVTLNPALGSTYESINQSGIAIATDVDEDTSDLKWRITSANSNYSTDEILDLITDGDLNVNIIGGEDVFEFDEDGSSYIDDLQEDAVWQIDQLVDLQGSAVVVSAYDSSEDDGYYIYDEDTTYLQLWTSDDVDLDDIKLSVRAFSDDNGNNELSDGEGRSSAVTVTLYDVRTISATTTIEAANVGAPLEAMTVLNKPLINTWFLTEDWSLNGSVAAAHYSDNSSTLSGAWDLNEFTVSFDSDWFFDTDKNEDGTYGNMPLYSVSDGNVTLDDTSTNYSTRAWFTDDSAEESEDFVRWLGSRSATSAVFAGSNADVDDIYGFAEEGDNLVQVEDYAYDVRDGIKSGVVVGQIYDNDAGEDLAASNVRVRATFEFDSLEEDALLTVTGVTGDAADGESLVAYGRTNADGRVSFTYNNSNADASDEDDFVVTFEVLLSTGVWVAADSLTFTWVDAYVDDFSVSDDALSGSSISLTYEAVDQFGKGVSTVVNEEDEDVALQVTVTGLDDDETTLDKTALAPQTKSLTNGSASFTFANYAAVDSFVWVAGLLHTAEYDKDDFTVFADEDLYNAIESNPPFVATQVYNNAATALIDGVENDYSNVVTYAVFKDGNYTEDEDFAEFVDTYGVENEDFEDSDEYEWISGSVLTANDNGAAYQTVTLTGSGIYFYGEDASGDSVLKSNSITLETDDNGQWGVYVYSHKHNTAGQSITISSGGKSFTTKLKTYMNDEIGYDEVWNGSEWVGAVQIASDWKRITGNERDGITAPKRKGQYTTTVKVTDFWGNVLVNADVEVDANNVSGSISAEDRSDIYYEDWDQLQGSADTGSDGTIRVTAGANVNDFATRNESFMLRFYVDYYDYDDGDDSVDFDFDTDIEGYSGYEEENYGTFGPQAHAVAGAKKGVVRVHAFNVKGKTVSVFVGGKLVKTTTSDKVRFLTKVKGVKAGDKRVTVKVGAKRMLSTFVSVK